MRQQIEPMNLPTVDAVNARRIDKFKARIIEAAANEESKRYRPILEQLEAKTDLAPTTSRPRSRAWRRAPRRCC